MELDPNNFDANLSYARFCVTEGNFEKAMELSPARSKFSRTILQAPFLLQIVYRSLGRLEESEKYAPARAEASRGSSCSCIPKTRAPRSLAPVHWLRLGEKDKASEMARTRQADRARRQ